MRRDKIPEELVQLSSGHLAGIVWLLTGKQSEWVAGDGYSLQNERGTTFVFTEIEGVLQVA